MSLLDVETLSVRFGSTEAVRGITFSLERGERFGIIGESGSGKTLTALAIMGLLPESAHASGSIRLDGALLPQDELAMARLRGKRLGMVFQEPMTALNPLMRVGAQIAEAVALGAGTQGVGDLLGEVGLDPHHGARYPHQLSGGQRQRVMIAMALASEPDLLIADEPTSALDLITQRKILDLLAEVCERRHMALLFISHDLKAVAALCSRVAVMQHGRIVESGAVADVLVQPRDPYTLRLVTASRLDLRPRRAPLTGQPLLTVEKVSRSYGQGGAWWWRQEPLRAVSEVSFTVRAGECLAIVGPSGCGKTTLARIIVGLDRASSGTLQLGAERYHGSDLPRHLRRDLSLVFQDPFGSFDPRMTIGRSLAEPLRLEAGLAPGELRQRLAEAVLSVGLKPEMLERYPHEFSGGQRQRLAIARALVTRPKLVVLDEPVSALDMSVRGEVLALLARLQQEFGLTFILVSHDLDTVRAMADRVLVMERGAIVEEAPPETLFAEPRHPLTRALVAARLPPIG
jgi:peptide/nickel transport system ATP-binding protein